MKTPVLLTAVPAALWERAIGGQSPLADAAAEALAIEARLPKKVNVQRDLARYIACCEVIEEFAREGMVLINSIADFENQISLQDFPTYLVGDEYSTWVSVFSETDPDFASAGRLTASFFPPADLQEHFRKLSTIPSNPNLLPPADITVRMRFFDLAIKNRCGVIVGRDIYLMEEDVSPGPVPGVRPVHGTIPDVQPALTKQVQIKPVLAVELPRRSELEAMRVEIARALGTGDGLNISSYRHGVIERVLYENVFVPDGPAIAPVDLPILYGDGSQAAPFPLRCLSAPSGKIAEFEKIPALKFCLLSVRHPEMDGDVDAAWFPNFAASRPRDAIADTDNWCYEESLKIIRNLASKRDRTVIEMYQTGLEPAVVGFYRAVVNLLCEGVIDFAVRARIFRGPGQYSPGRWWL